MREARTRQFRHRVLVLFPSVENRAQLLRAVNAAGMVPRFGDSFEEGKRALDEGDVDLVICEDCVSGETIKETANQARRHGRPIPVVVTSRTGEWAEFLSALQQGAFDYLPLPLRLEEMRRILNLALAETADYRSDRDAKELPARVCA
jgi:DNA-binding NtrC family response regulator